MINSKIPLIAVVGPTASGKTSLSVELAKKLSGEIVSADSMQIYKKMDIGTAKPTKEELACVPHHLIDIKEPNENFSCADYQARNCGRQYTSFQWRDSQSGWVCTLWSG